MFATLKISSRIGSITTKSTEGEINKPKNKTASKNKLMKKYPFFLAILVETKPTAIFFIKQVFDKAYVKTNVKSKNMNVALPKLFIKTLLKPKVSINPSAKMHKILG